jgi:natural product biosynthesis luciferase-like monooxygenase protein
MSDLSCFVVGTGAIPLSCLEVLAKNGWQILGVYSIDNSLAKWSQDGNIFHTNNRDIFKQQILDREFDYLFSINNTQWIVPTEVYTRARKASINFHDSPLPRYAGLYATSWALLNGETEHAVTWHEIADGVDTGRIFKQQTVPIFPDDTAFTLNKRCFIAAVDSFDKLTKELATEGVTPYEQDLDRRTYFGPTDRPAASSLLSFDVSTAEICNLVRSLEFGLVRNQMGIPKVWFPGGVVAVAVAQAIEMFKNAPAQVLYIDDDSVYISTVDGAVRLQSFTTLAGRELNIADLVADYGVRVGEMLPILDRTTLDAISERNAEICRFETAWEKSLLQLAPFEHPYLSIAADSPPAIGEIYRHPIVGIERIESPSLLAIFAAYCARLASDAEFDLGLQTEAQRSVAPEIFAQRVPLRVTTEAGESFTQFKQRLETAIARVNRMGSYRHSLLRRYLELNGRIVNLPVAIVSAPSPDRLDWQYLDAALALVTYEDGSVPEVIHGDAIASDRAAAIVSQLQTLVPACLQDPDRPFDRLPLLDAATQRQILGDWNQTTQTFPTHLCIHELFEQQVARTPDAIAVVAHGKSLTYQQLNERANQLAHYLTQQGVAPDVLVGLHVERSVEMMVGLIGIHKAGGAYVPLDPNFPPDRIALMIEDAGLQAIVTQASLRSGLVTLPSTQTIAIDTQWAEISRQPLTNPNSGVKPAHLSYVIYTSGSTGKPKGVMVEHRNVVNFFTGMDAAIDRDDSSVWLAVTSLSFDISVLELCWTLARGFKVVIYDAKAERASVRAPQLNLPHAGKKVDFSLFYFSSNEEGAAATEKYRLLLEGAKFADERGFKAVWTPERHFHAFGGLFPNAAVASAAIAATTKQIQIRAGSCVSPLHSSIRIAEDWAVVDNLSGGRVGISFAAGWQPNDFVLRPETFDRRKEIMFEQIEEVRALWQGQAVTYPNGKGEPVAVQTLPRPIQAELPIWITAAGNPETFQLAGAKGFNILTHLLGQSLEELAAKIAIYRQAWRANGHPGSGSVTLMLHTFVGESDRAVKEIVRQPMRQYLGSSLDLIQQAAWSFPTFKQKTTGSNGRFSTSQLSNGDLSEILDFSFERYFETSGLFGTVETCLQTIDRIKGIDVDEIGCLIDYGVDPEAVLAQLPLLDEVRRRSQPQSGADEPADYSIAGLIRQHQVTHLQCTPSMASMLLAEQSNRQALARVQHLMVGGEALSEPLANSLHQTIAGKIHNMYGPTETTIWSATHTLNGGTGIVPLGRPIANTELYILDRHQQPVPVGVAGELLIGGSGVTRGYLHRPELTRERFIPNPFNADPAARLYRTGDLVRYRPDGSLDFLGRIDFQVKVRGYRIELGEIETMLTRHPAVREAIAIVREDLPGDKRIVAYLLPEVGQQPHSAELRSYLRTVLPEYMVPSSFVVLAAFPLTPNQKIDRKALPAPHLVETPPPAPPAPPAPPLPTISAPPPIATEQPPAPAATANANRADIERNLIEIWQKVLQIPQVSPEDNFFNLGGNSLVAMTLIGEMRQTFEIELPLISLFRAPTIAEMEREICQLQQ